MSRGPRHRWLRGRLKTLRRRLRADLKAAVGLLRFRLRRRRLAASAEIRVQLVDGWTDGAEALAAMTPNGAGRVGRVHYALRHEQEPHYWLMLTSDRDGTLPPPQPMSRLWCAVGEPPIPESLRTIARTPAGMRVYAPAGYREYVPAGVDLHVSHCLLRTWHIGRGYDELRRMPLPADKSRTLSWITSDLRLLPGHRRRMDFLDRLRAEVTFDLFGRGFRPLADKWEGLAPYRYSIAFENSVFDGYFTEKLADPIMAGCLPLYHGCPDLERWLPAGSFLRFDPDDPLVFDRIREWVASDLWRERRPALEEAKALLLERYNTFRFLAGEFEADFPVRFGRRR